MPIHVQSHALSAIQQLQQYAIVFRNVFASNRILALEEATYSSLIGHEVLLPGSAREHFGTHCGTTTLETHSLAKLG